MTDADMTPDDLDVFARKLDDFARGLTPQESALLAAIVTRAASEDEDVEGHFFDIGPIIADPTVHLAHAYAMVAWQNVQPHLHLLVQHIAHGSQLVPHIPPHIPPEHPIL